MPLPMSRRAFAGTLGAAAGVAILDTPLMSRAIVTGDEMAAFARKVPASATILVDEAYHHFVEDPRYRSSLELIAKHPNVVVGRKFPSLPNWLRVTVGKRDEVAAFLAVLPEIVPAPVRAA